MNILHVILIIGLWLVAIFNAYNLFQNNTNEEDIKKLRKNFIKSLFLAIIYTVYKLGTL